MTSNSQEIHLEAKLSNHRHQVTAALWPCPHKLAWGRPPGCTAFLPRARAQAGARAHPGSTQPLQIGTCTTPHTSRHTERPCSAHLPAGRQPQHIAWPLHLKQLVLRLQGKGHSICNVHEGHMERVTLRVDLVPAVLCNTLAHGLQERSTQLLMGSWALH